MLARNIRFNTMTIERRTNVKFLVRLGKTPTEALRIPQDVYGDDAMSRALAFERHKRFKEGREDIEDDPRSGRPVTSRTEENVELLCQKVHGDRRHLTVRMIANELDMNCERVWTIITKDLGMTQIWAKMVPKFLKAEQKEQRVQVCHDILE